MMKTVKIKINEFESSCVLWELQSDVYAHLIFDFELE